MSRLGNSMSMLGLSRIVLVRPIRSHLLLLSASHVSVLAANFALVFFRPICYEISSHLTTAILLNRNQRSYPGAITSPHVTSQSVLWNHTIALVKLLSHRTTQPFALSATSDTSVKLRGTAAQVDRTLVSQKEKNMVSWLAVSSEQAE